MAKTTSPKGVVLTYPAITAYKQWVWAQIRKRNKTLQWLVDEMKRKARAELVAVGKYETISTATLSDLLGKERDVPPPSNSSLVPAINKALGIPPPPVCNPGDSAAQIRDRFAARWDKKPANVQQAITSLLGDDDESGLD